MRRAAAKVWVDSLAGAWRAGDPAAAAALFAADARYRSHPFREPVTGRPAIADYWQRAAERQHDLDLHLGSPIVDGDRVAVEWWVTLTEAGSRSTSTGTLFMRFGADGLCTSLREVWMEEAGGRRPYPGWGS